MVVAAGWLLCFTAIAITGAALHQFVDAATQQRLYAVALSHRIDRDANTGYIKGR